MLGVSTSDFIPSLWCWVRCAVSGTIPEARIQFLPFRLCVSALTQRQMCKELNTQLREFLGTLDVLEIDALSTHGFMSFTESSSRNALKSGQQKQLYSSCPGPGTPSQLPELVPFATTKFGDLSYLGILWSSVISGWFIMRSKIRFSRLHISLYGNFLSVS